MDLKKIVAIPLIILFLAGGYFLLRGKGGERQAVGFATPVTVAIVEKKTILDEVEAVGTASANESVDVTANVTETVEKINFEEGKEVKKGDVLVQLLGDSERAAVEEAEKQYERIKTLAETSAATLTRLDQQTLVLRQAKAALNDRILTAPFSGVVGVRRVSEGALVTPGQVVTTVDDLSRIKLDFSIPEKYLGRVALGQLVTATTVAYPGEVFRGSIYTLGTRIDQNTRAFQLRAFIPNDDYKLRGGMLMNVLLQVGSREALLIPEEAVNYIGDETYVYLVKEGKALRQPIVLGEHFKGAVEVKSGLYEGEEVIAEGGLRFVGGESVKVVGKKSIESSREEYLQYHE